jgi:hypothetical protein
MDNQGRDPIDLGDLPWLLRSVLRSSGTLI